MSDCENCGKPLEFGSRHIHECPRPVTREEFEAEREHLRKDVEAAHSRAAALERRLAWLRKALVNMAGFYKDDVHTGEVDPEELGARIELLAAALDEGEDKQEPEGVAPEVLWEGRKRVSEDSEAAPDHPQGACIYGLPRRLIGEEVHVVITRRPQDDEPKEVQGDG